MGPIDVLTLVVGAAISAVVATFFSVLTASRLTVARVRAERREAASLAIADIVRPWERLLLRYREGEAPTAQREAVAHSGDPVEVVHLLEAAEGLGSVRRTLVRLRCRRVFGREYTRLARLHLGQEQAVTMSVVLTANLVRRSWGRERPGTYLDGLLQRALQAQPGAFIQRRLHVELWLLRHLL